MKKKKVKKIFKIKKNLETAQIIKKFTNLLLQHSFGPEALNWGSRSSQELRFQVLSEIGISPGATVLDVGCGLGDFHAWQKRKGFELKYFGVDITPAMVEAAQKRFPDAKFQVTNLLEDVKGNYDYVIASGIFYLRKKNPQQFLENTIKKLFEKCRVGVAFNSLSGWSRRQEAGEFYADPLRTVDFCRTLCPFVTLRHDYHPKDFSVYLRREAYQK